MQSNVRLYTRRPWQKAVHDGLRADWADSVHVVKARRQVGKSLMVENILLEVGLTRPRSVSIAIEPTQAQARKLFKDIYAGCPALFKGANATLLELQLVNGSELLLKSAEQRENLRSYTVTGICCIDEGAYIRDDIFSITSPWVDVHHAPTLITSTPRFKAGEFHRYYELGMAGEPHIHAYDWNAFDTSEFLSPAKLEQYRRRLPSSQFTTEYLGEFLDTDAIIFRGFRKCIRTASTEPFKRVFVGIDWSAGTGDDFTVVCVLNERGEQIRLERWNDLGATESSARVVRIIRELEAVGYDVTILAETNGVGRPMVDLIRKSVTVREWNTSNKSKTEIITSLKTGFETEALTLLDDQTQTLELSLYECEYHPATGTVTYSAPDGFHDDTVMALAIAYRCLTEDAATGDYCIHSHRSKRHR